MDDAAKTDQAAPLLGADWSDALEDRVRSRVRCGSAWNKDPVSGLIGVQKGPS